MKLYWYVVLPFFFSAFVVMIVLLCTLLPTKQDTPPTSTLETKSHFSILNKPMYSHSGLFEDVLYFCPSIPPNTWQRMIAIEKHSQKIIGASNTFLTDEVWVKTTHTQLTQDYEKRYEIYKGMLNTHQTILSHETTPTVIETSVVLFGNSMVGCNSGHWLGDLIATLLYIKTIPNDQTWIPAIQSLGFKFPAIIDILDLFYDRKTWQILEFDILYHMKSAHFVNVDPRFIIQHYREEDVQIVVQDIIKRSTLRLANEGCFVPKKTKIILIKQRQNNSMHRAHDAYHGAVFFHKMEQKGWIVLNPEFDSIYYIIPLLASASHIIVSFGAIQWTHMLFFNKEANIYFFQQNSGEPAYEPVQTMKYFQSLNVEDTDLDGTRNESILAPLMTILNGSRDFQLMIFG